MKYIYTNEEIKNIFFDSLISGEMLSLIQTAYMLSGKPIVFFDINFSVLAQIPSYSINETRFDTLLQKKEIPHTFFNQLLRSSYLGFKSKSQGPFYLDYGLFKTVPRIYNRVIKNEKLFGHVFMICLDNNANTVDYFIIQTLCDSLGVLIDKSKAISPQKPPQTTYFLHELFTGTLDQRTDIEMIRLQLKIEKNMNFYVMVAQLSSNSSHTNIIFPFICKYIEDTTLHAMPLIIDEEIILLFFGKDEIINSKMHVLESIEKVFNYLISMGFTCGLSEHFFNLYDARFYKDQASQALTVGRQLNLNKKIFLFSDYLNYCIAKTICDVSNPKVYIHPAFKVLQDYDEIHHTSYLQTLIEYIKEFKNHSKTAKKLYIHRNSLSYRLLKISDLCKIDFDNPNICFQILLSAYIKELSN